MDFGVIVRQARKVTADNAPTILTAIGVTGAVTTAILAGKASFKAQRILDEHHHAFLDPALTKSDIFKGEVKLTWKLFVPAIGTGAITVVSIVAANHISVRRAAALASAYTISQEAFREYKDKVYEKLGENKEKKITDDIAQDRVNRLPPSVIIASNAKSLCLDTYSGRYFDCDMETIRSAVNDVNFRIINENYASLTDFWDMIGLSRTTDSDEIGWNTDMKLELVYSAALTEDGKPVLTIEFRTVPIRGYYSNR
jgi:hypothetical protein